jgi:hypothetical protein
MSADTQTAVPHAEVPRYKRCVPSCGCYPGEEHEALLSRVEHGVVVVVVRHLITGECSTVPIVQVRSL